MAAKLHHITANSLILNIPITATGTDTTNANNTHLTLDPDLKMGVPGKTESVV